MNIQSYRAYDPESMTSVDIGAFCGRLNEVMERFVDYAARKEFASRERLQGALRQELEGLVGRKLPLPGNVESSHAEPPHAFAHAVLDVDASAAEEEGVETSVPKTRLTALQYYYRYAEARVLAGILGRDAGIEAIKAYLDWVIEQRPPSSSGPETITEMRGRDIPWNLDDRGQDAISVLLSDYQCLKKVTACRTHQVLKHLDDPGMLEAIACYPDHASMRRTNPHFVLTRTQTLIGGAEYCDTCFHDTRHSDASKHPSREIFEQLMHETDA